MISQIEALNYRCLKHIKQPLNRFHLLVGPNASGKTTFLDAVAFLSDFVREGLIVAIEKRTPNFQDLLFNREGKGFELAIEVEVPQQLQKAITYFDEDFVCRYDLAVECKDYNQPPIVTNEVVRLKVRSKKQSVSQQRFEFPDYHDIPDTLFESRKPKIYRRILSKDRLGKTNFYSETDAKPGKGWVVNLKLAQHKSALANLPEDEEKFSIGMWLKRMLIEGVQSITLDGQTLRKASRPNQATTFLPDAANLPWVIEGFRQKNRKRFQDWIAHLQEALPWLKDVRTILREEDKFRYLMLKSQDGREIPSWTTSDGTLRFLALTLPAFLPEMQGIFLIEEPENGIHPKVVEILFEALSNVRNAQVLVTTHSPVLLGKAQMEDILCFAKNEDGATDIVNGDAHPMLQDWRRDIGLQDYFVSGVLG